MQSKLVVLCAVAILGLSSPAVAKGGGGGGGKGGSSHGGMHGHGHFDHGQFRNRFLRNQFLFGGGWGWGAGVHGPMTTLGAATPLLYFSRKRSPRWQLARSTRRPVTGNSRTSQSRPQGAERDRFKS
jgi:hypothetical protein